MKVESEEEKFLSQACLCFHLTFSQYIAKDSMQKSGQKLLE